MGAAAIDARAVEEERDVGEPGRAATCPSPIEYPIIVPAKDHMARR